MEDPEFTAEELARFLETAERLLQDVTRRPLAPSRNEPSGLIFDWEFLSLTNPAIVNFIAEVHYPTGKNKLRFQLDIAQLQSGGRTADLERLSDILAARHAGTDDRRSLLQSLEWLLTVSLEQTAPELSLSERQLQAHQLLFLPEPQLGPSATLLTLGVSPLLFWINQRARTRLWDNHSIEIGELERESVQLYVGLEQFEEIPPKPDFRVRAEAYTEKLITHHRLVKRAGELLGGRLGEALVTLAELAVTRLLESRSG